MTTYTIAREHAINLMGKGWPFCATKAAAGQEAFKTPIKALQASTFKVSSFKTKMLKRLVDTLTFTVMFWQFVGIWSSLRERGQPIDHYCCLYGSGQHSG